VLSEKKLNRLLTTFYRLNLSAEKPEIKHAHAYITLPEELYKKLNELEARIKRLESIILDKNVVQLKEVPIDEACQLVLEYLKKHPGAHTSDIVFALEIDNEIVEQALKKLWEEGKVEPVEEEKIGATLQ